MPQPPVIIIGAGLAGLACALELERNSVPCHVLEASDAPGGRVRTDSLDGYLLDRGFQVYLNDSFHRVMDPWREPFAALSGLLNPVGSMRDKLLVARLRASSLAGSPDDILKRPEVTTLASLKAYGFSDSMIDRFFRPFFGGIMLDSSLSVSSRMLEYVFRMMASGDTVLPAQGMGALPAQLAARLKPGTLALNTRAVSLTATSVTIASGETLPARAVIVATEASTATQLLTGQLAPVSGRHATNIYFAIDGPAPLADPIIVLNGAGGSPIQNVCFPSSICPTYAPAGKSLVSATVLGDPDTSDAALANQVRQHLGEWFSVDTQNWRLLRVYRIRNAHPDPQPHTVAEQPVRLASGVFICGDHRFMPSIQSALVNGRHAAEAVLSHAG
jgi:phytoene dehydrogenase-like protein